MTLAPGLGLTNRIIIDQHFRQRDRLGRLLAALAYNPFAIGIGLDEDTAAFIGPDETLEVVGSGGITIVDPSNVEYSSMDSVGDHEPVCLIGLRLHILTARRDVQPAHPRGHGTGRRRHQALTPVPPREAYAHPRDLGLPRPEPLRAFPGDPPDLDLGRLEAWPTGRLGPASPTRCSRRCPASGSTAAPTASRAASCAACPRTRAPGSATCSSTSRSSCRTSPARTSPSARPARPDAPGRYHVVFEYEQEEVGLEAARLALTLLHSLLPDDLRPPRSVPADFDFAAERDAFIRFAQRRALGPEHRVAGARRRGARHPVAPPQRRTA